MMITALLILIVSALALALVYDYRYRRHWTGYTFGYPLRGLEGKLFFTFDDGPACFGKVLKGEDDTHSISDPVVRETVLREIPDYDFSKTATENLLDLLKKHDAKAIFFLWGNSIEACPVAEAVIRRMVAEGHWVGNHSFSHGYASKNPLPEILADFAHNHDLIVSLSGRAPSLFRPPYGDWEPDFSKRFLSHPPLKGYTFPIFWTSLFREWALKSVGELGVLEERMMGFWKSCNGGQGKILLLHDTYISALLLTAKILKDCERKGYVVGDPATIARAAAKETELYRKMPFVYYLKNLKDRALLKLSLRENTHTNYHMEQ
jgi:peptidoglycan/xylan/chitin deacetylase (PgdA/CDA1 family)